MISPAKLNSRKLNAMIGMFVVSRKTGHVDPALNELFNNCMYLAETSRHDAFHRSKLWLCVSHAMDHARFDMQEVLLEQPYIAGWSYRKPCETDPQGWFRIDLDASLHVNAWVFLAPTLPEAFVRVLIYLHEAYLQKRRKHRAEVKRSKNAR